MQNADTAEGLQTEWRSLEDMSDRELLEEMATNMRATYDMFNAMSASIQQHGIMGLAKGLFSNGKG